MIHDRESGWSEAEVIINGHPLSFAESMALRVAVSSFRMFVCEPSNAKDIGERLAEGYDHHLTSIEAMMHGKARS